MKKNDPSGASKTDSDVAITERFRSGCQVAFSVLYRRYDRQILSFIREKTGDQETARDLQQEVFLKAHRFRDRYDPKYAFSTWLWTIARNTIFDWKRARMNEPRLYTATQAETATVHDNIENRVASECLDAEATLLQTSDRKTLKRLLMKFTRPQRRVIWLRIVHQLSHLEIARKLGLSLAAVKCLSHRSKKAVHTRFLIAECP